MKELIEVFKMTEIDQKVRVKIIIRLGKAINNQHAMNLTEPIVFELVKLLDSENAIFKDVHFLKHSSI